MPDASGPRPTGKPDVAIHTLLAEATAVTIALVAVAASLGALVLVLLVLLARRRPPSREELARELGASLDLDEVLSRTLAGAAGIAGAEAAVVSLTSPGGEPLLVTRGLTAEEAAAGPREGSVAVPLASEEGPIGSLTVFGRALGDGARSELERLAMRAGPAIDNAQRFREARQLADLDALTSLHNRRYFHETLEREVARARRYERRLALLVFDLDDFKDVNDRVGHLAGDAVLAEAADRVRDVVRSADVACRVGGDEFAVILPESTLADADQLYRRIQAAVSARPLAQVGELRLSAGVAELRAEDDSVSLFQRADEALYRAKGAGKGRVAAAG